MTYTVSSGTLNSTTSYHTFALNVDLLTPMADPEGDVSPTGRVEFSRTSECLLFCQ